MLAGVKGNYAMSIVTGQDIHGCYKKTDDEA